ncbi:MAG: hypothetical protein J5517_01475 [Eubacterium sp.]|nr:hypothetical protein [Eubacterium sp.]
MFRVVNEYISKLNISTDPEIYEKMETFLKSKAQVTGFSINVNYNRYIVDVKLKKYTVAIADKLYRSFEAAVCYPYSHISVRYNEENRVRYRLVTCREDKRGVYMDIIFSEK